MEPERARYFVMNHVNQPLELHLAGGVVVLGPYQEKEIRAAELGSAQLQVFKRQRLVSVREEAVPEPAQPAEPESNAEASATEKPDGAKRRGSSKKEG